MKRTLLSLLFIAALSFSSRAQYISIADTNFVNALRIIGYSSCMSGNTIDTVCAQLYTVNHYGNGYMLSSTLRLSGYNISDLTGFASVFSGISVTGLFTYDLSHNNLSQVPPDILARGITRSYCTFDMSYNHIDSFTLTHAYDYTGGIILAYNGMHQFYAQNSLVGAGFHTLNLNDNNLDSFPAIEPNGGGSYLSVRRNNIRNPVYTNFSNVDCGVNQISGTMSFASTTYAVSCDSNLITAINMSGSNVQTMNCSHNLIHTLTYSEFLYPLLSLTCNDNNLTTLPKLTSVLTLLDCHNNPNLECIPSLPNVPAFELDFSNTAIACLPRLFTTCTYTGSPSVTSVPQCNLLNNPYGCPQYANMEGYTYIDTSGICDSNTTGPRMGAVKVEFLDHGVVTQQYYTDMDSGHYSFDEIAYGNYTLQVDTSSIPLDIHCPDSLYYTATVDSQELYQTRFNFGMYCKPGFDIGAVSWGIGNFNPGDTTRATVYAGDMSWIYGLHCATGISGQVQIAYSGPVRYIGMASGGLTPGSISGDTLRWNIADFGTVDVITAFTMFFTTDSSALPDDPVCFSVTVTPTAGDNNPSNNNLYFCTAARRSHDPNFKEVYPSGNIDTTQKWLTYTIHFQNNGTDTARNIYLLDTLDSSFDPSTFQLLHTSHKSVTEIGTGGIVQFIFPKINLPDSAVNPSGSQGWVQYKVKLRNGLPIGTIIDNTSYVYFDLNPPIATNTTQDIISFCSPQSVWLNRNTCGSYVFQSSTITLSGIYRDTLTATSGCDSMVTLNLAVNNLPVQPNITQNGNTLSTLFTGNIHYQWQLNGSNLPGDTNAMMTVTQNGNYTVEITDSNGCSSVSVIKNLSSVGVSEVGNEEMSVTLRPNPANESCTLYLYNATGNFDARLTDVSGREVGRLFENRSFDSVHSFTFPVSGYAKGIYLIKVSNNEGFNILKKLVVE